MDTRVQVEHAPTRCPFCKDEIGKGDELVACAACAARHHAGCHRQHGACASCGSLDVLVSPTRKARRDQPPTGSRIQVERGERSTRFAWKTGQPQDSGLMILLSATIILIPLVLWFMHLREKFPEASLELGEDELTFLSAKGSRPVIRTVKRSELGAVRVSPITPQQGGSGYMLTIDVGIERLGVWTSFLAPALTGPELEWLAAQIEAWRDD